MKKKGEVGRDRALMLHWEAAKDTGGLDREEGEGERESSPIQSPV